MYNFTEIMDLYIDFWLETAFYRCQNGTFQFYNCKLVGPKQHPKLKGGYIIHRHNPTLNKAQNKKTH